VHVGPTASSHSIELATVTTGVRERVVVVVRVGGGGRVPFRHTRERTFVEVGRSARGVGFGGVVRRWVRGLVGAVVVGERGVAVCGLLAGGAARVRVLLLVVVVGVAIVGHGDRSPALSGRTRSEPKNESNWMRREGEGRGRREEMIWKR
jgi:hypothetical protein